MEKHCERQHGIVPPGGRGHFIGTSASPTLELTSIPSPFKQIRAYPIMSTIGNASGYIGFLVGVSISELPQLIFWLFSKCKHYYEHLRNLFEDKIKDTHEKDKANKTNGVIKKESDEGNDYTDYKDNLDPCIREKLI